MSEGNNTRIIDACIEEFKDSNQFVDPVGKLFELFVGIQATKDQDLSAEDVRSAVVDGSNDGGIDLFLPLVDDQPVLTSEDASDLPIGKQTTLSLLVIQAKHKTSFEEGVLDKWMASMGLILDLGKKEVDLSQRFNPSLCEKIFVFRDLLFQVSRKGGTRSIRYIYANRSNEFHPSPAFVGKVAQLEQLTQQAVASVRTSVECLSAKELFDLYQREASERRDLSFSGNPLAVKYGEGIGYVGLVPIGALRRFISTEAESPAIDERIFESNVRHFQGSADVNAKIKGTVKGDRVHDFWWLNNGVTIVAPEATPLANTLTISNPQIVNGLQTSYSIFHALSESDDAQDDSRCVLVKVIVSSEKATVDMVISATNSQTAVHVSSLRATDEVQRSIEAYFESRGFFYDRRKNYYRNLRKPLARIFSISYLAQAVHAILNHSPAAARARPTSLIKEESTYQSIFDASKPFEAYLKACLIAQLSKNFVSSIEDEVTRVRMGNYVFHLARVATSFALGAGHYAAKSVENLSLESISAALPTASDWLDRFISDYQRSSGISNNNTLSKSSTLSEAMNSSLFKHFDAKAQQVLL